jgi:hypothetical protein
MIGRRRACAFLRKVIMTTFHEFIRNEGRAPVWPYPIRYDREQVIETDVLVIGGGIAGCWAAISTAGGPRCDHWCDTAASLLSKVNPDEWAQMLNNICGGYGNGIGCDIQRRENYEAHNQDYGGV